LAEKGDSIPCIPLGIHPDSSGRGIPTECQQLKNGTLSTERTISRNANLLRLVSLWFQIHYEKRKASLDATLSLVREREGV